MNRLSDKPLHVATLIILIVVGGLYWYAREQEHRHGEAASAYLRAALTDIGSWNSDALRRQLAPETLAAIDAAHMEALVSRYRELGPFVAVDDPRFGTLTAALSLLGGNALLSYSGRARFQNGSAHFTATLIRHDARFRLYNLNFGEPQRTGASSPAP